MKRTRTPLGMSAGLLMLAMWPTAAPLQHSATAAVLVPKVSRQHTYSSCASCANCHLKSYQEHRLSMHSGSFANPVFLAQYQQDVLPLVESGSGGFRRARSCTACHAPVAHKLARANVVKPDSSTAELSGVTCDFCHTIAGYHDAEPGNGNYLPQPGETKFGPFQTRTAWHHEYSQLQTRSEFCAICHSVRNQYGLDVKSTYAEWRSSRHAREGIQCQDCHMSVNGFLTEGRAVHESGVAAVMTLGSAPARGALYTHRFLGGRTQSQIQDAIQLLFQPLTRPVGAGGDLEVTLLVDNSRTGHKMPSGSVELRFLWLDVEAELGTNRLHLEPLPQPTGDGYAVTGAHEAMDRDILGGGVPAGHRIYRTILEDRRGRTTLAFYDARRIAFDNRLCASEVREECYRLKLPPGTEGRVALSAHLYYVAYPDAFAKRLALPKAVPFEIASASMDFSVGP